MVDNSLLTL